jgi:GntR family transcriptional repressor for pyruvate dehydrogenase complex
MTNENDRFYENFEPMDRERLSDTVARRLREQIHAHGRVEGDRLPSIADMARGFRVGPPTVREALKKLEALGLVELRQGAGVFVGRGLSQLLESLRDVLGDDVLTAERMSRDLAREPIARKTVARSRRLAG